MLACTAAIAACRRGGGRRLIWGKDTFCKAEEEQVQLYTPASPWTFDWLYGSEKFAIQQLNGRHIGEAGQLQLKGVLVEGVRDMIPRPGNRVNISVLQILLTTATC